MKTITLTRSQFFFAACVWLVAFAILEMSGANNMELLNIVGFLTLSVLPGFLTVLIFQIKGLPIWGYIALMVGFSLLELMLIGLLGNTLLPFIGVTRPLDKPYLFDEISLLIVALIFGASYRFENITLNIKKYILFNNTRDLVLAFTPLLFVILAILGAIHLNDGGSGIVTMIMLGLMGLYICLLLYFSDKTEDNTLPTALFFMALSLLLMTSLRGWYVTGHDIQQETKVFELAKNAGLWNMATYRDAYNACLSITILPTIFNNLLNAADQYIFKVPFQIFFALCPVLVYLIGNQWARRKIAFCGAIYFIAFPTYFSDMPFLVRQETAFLFFGLMLFIIFQENLSISLRRALFVIMGVGVILSHYSTTYIVLIIFGLATLSRPFFLRIGRYLQKNPLFVSSAITMPINREGAIHAKISLLMIGLLFVVSFFWTTIITQTSNNVTGVLEQTVTAVSQGFGGSNRSIDATSLLTFSSPDLNTTLQAYITNVAEPTRESGQMNDYYPVSDYDKYPIKALTVDTLPISAGGEFLDKHHINVTAIMPYVGQLLAKSAEIFIPVGLIYLLFRKNIISSIDTELYLIAFYSLIFVGMNIVLPVLSVQYGIFRAIQQALFVIAPVLVAGSIFLGSVIVAIVNLAIFFLKKRYLSLSTISFKKWNMVFASLFVVLFFIYSTGFIPQLFGNNSALLHLNNTGEYYDDFLTQTQEVYSINWLSGALQNDPKDASEIQFEVQSDRFSSSKLASTADLTSMNDILPLLIRRDAYVFLSVVNVTKQRASLIYSGDRIPYTYPVQFLDSNKNLVYNNGGSRIYR